MHNRSEKSYLEKRKLTVYQIYAHSNLGFDVIYYMNIPLWISFKPRTMHCFRTDNERYNF